MTTMNGTESRTLERGIYCALPCFFKDDTEEIDVDAFVKHAVYVAKAGCYPVISGSMGEAIHLSSTERCSLISATRKGLDQAGLSHIGLLVGAGAASTRRTIELVLEAASSGADQAMVILDGYYAGLLKANPQAIEEHYLAVAKASPIPVMIYNFPAVTGGIDLDDRLLASIAAKAPNTCGVKLTCANVGKMTRLAAATKAPQFLQQHPRTNKKAPFLLLAGQIDILLAGIPVGSDGTIGGVPNFAPLACAKLWQLSQKELTGDNLLEVNNLQAVIARADGAASKAGIPGMKYVLSELFAYGSACRRPLPTLSKQAGQEFLAELSEILELEKQLTQSV